MVSGCLDSWPIVTHARVISNASNVSNISQHEFKPPRIRKPIDVKSIWDTGGGVTSNATRIVLKTIPFDVCGSREVGVCREGVQEWQRGSGPHAGPGTSATPPPVINTRGLLQLRPLLQLLPFYVSMHGFMVNAD